MSPLAEVLCSIAEQIEELEIKIEANAKKAESDPTGKSPITRADLDALVSPYTLYHVAEYLIYTLSSSTG